MTIACQGWLASTQKILNDFIDFSVMLNMVTKALVSLRTVY
jgi:hypothetical protein